MEKKLSIVVPYRNREEHLKQFAPYMEEYLIKGGIPFHIYVIHQADEKPFNRAKLLNVGFKESEGFDYFAFHDVDMLPIDSDYSYIDCPTHLASRAEQFGFRLPYDGYFGGVTLFDKESFVKINGYSNEYWGWGAEDDDILLRCSIMGVNASRKDCGYRSLSHDRSIPQDLYNKNLEKFRDLRLSPTKEKIFLDGLESLSYEKIKEEKLSEFCSILDVKL
jgi:predicted glycosyltransferase involved in capsule biosynthesis